MRMLKRALMMTSFGNPVEGSSRRDRLRIARRFNAGNAQPVRAVPKGRLNRRAAESSRSRSCQSPLRGSFAHSALNPTLKRWAIFTNSLRDKASNARRAFALTTILCAGVVAGAARNAPAAEIVVAMTEGAEDQTIPVPVTATNATGIVAAAFSVVFDTNALAVEVTTTVFGTFAEQFAESAAINPRETSAVIDGVTSLRPFRVAAQSNGVSIAGVRRLPATNAESTLLTLKVSLRPGAAPGLYPINVQATTLHLAAAGYDSGGEEIDLLIGRDRVAGAYPVLLAAEGASMHLVPGYVNFGTANPDVDGDGLPDVWEQEHFENLDIGNAETDTDGDGLKDILEYFMGADPNRAESEFVIRGQLASGEFKMLFPMRTGHGLNFTIDWSSDLVTWSSSDIILTPRPELGTGADWSIYEASVSTEGAGMIFLRLRLRQ